MTAAPGRPCGLWLVVLVAGCATVGGPTRGGPAPRTSSLPAAEHYSTSTPSGPALLGSERQALAQGLARASEAAGRTPTEDPRLGALAAWALAFFAVHDRFPRAEAIDFEAHRLGLVEPVPSLGLLASPRDELAGNVGDQLAPMLAQQQYTHVGAASERLGDHARTVIALSARPLQLAPIPVVSQEGSLTLAGELAVGFRSPELILVGPDGKSLRRTLARGRKFDAKVPLRQAGAYRVELLAEGRHGTTVLANFPVYHDAPAPSPPDPLPMREDAADTPEAMRARMLALINQTRAEAGLGPLELHAALSRVARAHNLDMLQQGFVGHTSPSTGTPQARVVAAGFSAPLIAENIGSSYSLQGVHENLMASPGHRDNILHRDATHVGIDVQATPRGDRHEFLVTEVFVRFIPELAPDDAEGVLSAINRRRSSRGAPPLTLDKTMSRLAAGAAKAHFKPGAGSQEQSMQALTRRRRQTRLPYAAVSQVMTVVSNLASISALPEVLDPKARAIGIGLAQGQRAGSVPNAVSVVLLLGY